MFFAPNELMKNYNLLITRILHKTSKIPYFKAKCWLVIFNRFSSDCLLNKILVIIIRLLRCDKPKRNLLIESDVSDNH